MLSPFRMVCRDFILPEPASYVFFYAFSNLRNLLYIIYQQPRLTNKYYYGISSKILLAMTAEDHERCYEYLLDYKEENPNISNIELDKVATEFYIQMYENKGSVTRL